MSTKIEDRMRERGFKDDAALAAVVKCDRSMVTRIRLGKATPSLALALRLSKALDLDAGAFMPTTPKPMRAASKTEAA